jgi:Tfp pilus assembly protein PilE
MHTRPRKSSRRGFHVVELLLILTVLTLLIVIGLPALANNQEIKRIAVAQQQAQGIASIYASGRQAGAFAEVTSVASAMNAVGLGARGTGSMANRHFRLFGISATMDNGKPLEQQATHYLTFSKGILQYSPNGTDAGFWGPWAATSSDCFKTNQEAKAALAMRAQNAPLGRQQRISSFRQADLTRYFVETRFLLKEDPPPEHEPCPQESLHDRRPP